MYGALAIHAAPSSLSALISSILNSLVPTLIFIELLFGTMNEPVIVPLASVVKVLDPSGWAVVFLRVLPKSESASA